MAGNVHKTPHPIVIALAKGRILQAALPLLRECGISPVENPVNTRKLLLRTNLEHVNIRDLLQGQIITEG